MNEVMGFWSFIFPETYIHYRSCIYFYFYMEEKSTQLYYGFNILDKLDGCPQENQNPYPHMEFNFLEGNPPTCQEY